VKSLKGRVIIGIDPGTNFLGYAIIESIGKQIEVREVDTIKLKKMTNAYEKLYAIFGEVQDLVYRFRPQEMAIEAPFYGKNVQSMLKLGRAQGVAIAAGMVQKLDITEYAPKTIKLAITGNGNASKEQVAALLGTLLKIDVSKLSLDSTDALAVALCHYYRKGKAGSGGENFKDWGAFLKKNPERKA